MTIQKKSNSEKPPITHSVTVINQKGEKKQVTIPTEIPLTIKVDGQELVTLMTLGMHQKDLVLGYVRNQGLITDPEAIESITVDWENETADIATISGNGLIEMEKTKSTKVVTSGCGQGTLFSCNLDKLYNTPLKPFKLRQSTLYTLLKSLSKSNSIYKTAGSIHGCALCHGSDVLLFFEDVGRHNAADAISGRMWTEHIKGTNKILYTTGRLTSEIVMKSAAMEIPVLVSRSGVTRMGLDLAIDLGMTIIGRAKGSNFSVFSGEEFMVFDVVKQQIS